MTIPEGSLTGGGRAPDRPARSAGEDGIAPAVCEI